MGKKAQWEIIASQYYIEMQMSIASISKRTGVSEKSLFDWKKEGEWDKKRARYLKSQYSCNQSLYELLQVITKKALEDYYKEGIIPDQKTLYFIMNMAGKLKDLKAFEANSADEKIAEIKEENSDNLEKQEKTSTDDILKKILEAMTTQ